MPFSFREHSLWQPEMSVPMLHAGREYERLRLSTGLQCILIKDASSHMISAAMTVGGGSFLDLGVLGLAHLCEHVVCLSEEQVHLQKILMACGGSFSASTGTDQTTFGFEVSTFAELGNEPFVLDVALPLFACILKAPKIHGSVVAREIGFVDDEHGMNKSDVEKILWHALRLLSNKHHAFRRFATGNRATLAGMQGLKKLITDHHARAYLPANTALVIKGPQSINHLRRVVIQSYENLNPLTEYSVPRSYGELFMSQGPNCIFIKSDCRRIRFNYAMTRGTERVPTAMMSILCNVLGDESATSVCHYLRNTKQYIESLYVYTQTVSKSDTLFVIALEATDLGMSRIKEILAVVFHYIEDVMMKLPAADWMVVALEYVEIHDSLFLSMPLEENGADEVTSYAESLQAGLEDVVRGDWNSRCLTMKSIEYYLGDFFDRSLLKLQIAGHPRNILELMPDSPKMTRDRYFDFEYVLMRCPFDEVVSFAPEELRVAKPIGALRRAIPDLLEIDEMATYTKHRHMSHAHVTPIRLHDGTLSNIWVRRTQVEPRTLASFYVDFRTFPKTEESLVLLEMLVTIAGHRLKSKLYKLELFGATWGMYANIHGEPSILVTAGGRLTIVSYVIETAFRELISFSRKECGYNELKAARVLLRKKFQGYVLERGIKQVHVMMFRLLEEGIVLAEERIKALELVEARSLSKLSQGLLKCQSPTKVLLSGDLSDLEVYRIAKKCAIRQQAIPDFPERPLHSSIMLNDGAYYEFKLSEAEDDLVSVVLYYVQMASRTDLYTYTLSKLLQMMIASSAHHNLRDKRGLAYTIATGMKAFRTTFGLHVTVPTTKHLIEHIIEQIEAYFGDLEESVMLMTEETLDSRYKAPFLQAMADNLEETANPSSLFGSIKPLQGSETQDEDAHFHEHWCALDQIIRGTFNFGSRQCEEVADLAVVRRLTLAEFQGFFKAKFAVDSPERAAVVVTRAGSCEHGPRERRGRLSSVTKIIHLRHEKQRRERHVFSSLEEFQKHTQNSV